MEDVCQHLGGFYVNAKPDTKETCVRNLPQIQVCDCDDYNSDAEK